MLAATLRQAAPRLAYVIADHQNPTGLTLPAADRERLVALARATRTPLVIDEAVAGLHLDGGEPPAPVAALDPDGETVITIGSMSKTFWAGLRIGWVRASPALVRRLATARSRAGHLEPGARAADGGRAAGRRRCRARAPARRRPRAARHVRAALREQCRRGASRCPPAACRCGSSSTPRAAPRSPRSPTATACASPPGRASASTARSSAIVRLPYSLPAPVLEDAAERLARRLARGHRVGARGRRAAPALVA